MKLRQFAALEVMPDDMDEWLKEIEDSPGGGGAAGPRRGAGRPPRR